EQRISTPTSRAARGHPDTRPISVRGYLLCRTTEEEEKAGPAADPRLLVTTQRAPQATSVLPDGVQAAASADRRRQQECASIALSPEPPANPTSPRVTRPSTMSSRHAGDSKFYQHPRPSLPSGFAAKAN